MAQQYEQSGANRLLADEETTQAKEASAAPEGSGPDEGGRGERRKKPLLERLGIIELVVPNRPADEQSASAAVTPAMPQGAPEPASGENLVVEQVASAAPPLIKHSIANIYDKFNLEKETTRNVFLIEKFVKALPANLPADVRRQTIIDLLHASQVNMSKLVQDGNNRRDILQQFSRDFALRADEIIAAHQRQIRKLNDMIAQHSRTIEEHQRLKDEQGAEIEYELQNLANILRAVENPVR